MQSRYEKLHMVMIPLCLLYSQDVKPAGTIPFDIEDFPDIQTIRLRRQYGNEEIKVEVLETIRAIGIEHWKAIEIGTQTIYRTTSEELYCKVWCVV